MCKDNGVFKSGQIYCRRLYSLNSLQDTSVMNAVPGTYTVIRIKTGFTEEESLHLLSSHLKVIIDKVDIDRPTAFLPHENDLIFFYIGMRVDNKFRMLTSELCNEHSIRSFY